MKLKNNKAASKRFKKTASGKFKFKRAFKNHILTKKSPAMKRSARARGIVDKTNQLAVERMLANL